MTIRGSLTQKRKVLTCATRGWVHDDRGSSSAEVIRGRREEGKLVHWTITTSCSAAGRSRSLGDAFTGCVNMFSVWSSVSAAGHQEALLKGATAGELVVLCLMNERLRAGASVSGGSDLIQLDIHHERTLLCSPGTNGSSVRHAPQNHTHLVSQ